MAEVRITPSYTVKFTEPEYKLVTRALAALAGIGKLNLTPDDRVEASMLNTRLLEVAAADLRERAAVAEGALTKARAAANGEA